MVSTAFTTPGSNWFSKNLHFPLVKHRNDDDGGVYYYYYFEYCSRDFLQFYLLL